MIKAMLHSPLVRRARRTVEQLRYGTSDVFLRNAPLGNALIKRTIQRQEAAAMGKIGDGELAAVRAYLRFKDSAARIPKTAPYRLMLSRAPGVYPDDYETFHRWGDLWTTQVLPAMSHLGVWFNFNESHIIKQCAPSAALFHSYGLEPYIFNEPWSEALAGKKVAVVSPFPKTIQKQYPLRASIWQRNPRVLPDFELITLKCPAHPLLVKPAFPDWFGALEDMKQRIQETRFDVLLVGAGAYSLPLCAYARSLGKIGIHLGGNTQLLFGIYGKRWLVKTASIDHRFFNEAWCYPLQEETPPNCTAIEDGGYWK